jgi:integrase
MQRWRLSSSTHVVEYAGAAVADNVRRSWKTARRGAGLGPDVTPHTLRHTFASWAVQDGHPFSLVAEALGMTEAMVRRVYGHLAPEHTRGVVQAVSGRGR